MAFIAPSAGRSLLAKMAVSVGSSRSSVMVAW
jgi:hypothetical protein